MPFYKRNGDDLLSAPNFVQGPDFLLEAETHASHVYPVQGWYWFDTLEAALEGLTGAPDSNGVPQVISYRQAKTCMQLYPVGDSDLWTLANAYVDAIADRTERIMMQNFLRDSTQYERTSPALSAMGQALGLDAAGIDALFLQAFGM